MPRVLASRRRPSTRRPSRRLGGVRLRHGGVGDVEYGLGKKRRQEQAHVALPEPERLERPLNLSQGHYGRLPHGGVVVDLASELGRPGMPWSGGLLHLEDHEDLMVRPGLGKPSVYWDLRKDPLIGGMHRKFVSILAGTPYRVDKPELPEWLQGDALATYCRDLQYAYCSRIFHAWSHEGRGGFKRFVRDSARTVPIEGWGWWELVAKWRRIDFGPGLGSHQVLLPELPKWRAPWSLWWWLTQNEELAGIVAGFGYSVDYGSSPGAWQTTIPAAKILHVSTGQIGSNLEGRSWLRDLYNTIHGKRDGGRLEQLAYEIQAVRELFFKTGEQGAGGNGNHTNLEEYIDHRKADHGPGGVLPPGVAPHWSPDSIVNFDPMMHRHDRNCTANWGQVDLLMAADGTGSLAARQIASSDSRDGFDEPIGEMVCEPAQEVFRRMIEQSFPRMCALGHCYPPTLGYGQVEEMDQGAYVVTLGTAKEKGLLGGWVREDAQSLRELLNLAPLPDEPSEPGSKTLSQVQLAQGRPGWTPVGDGASHVGIFARLPAFVADQFPDSGGNDDSPTHMTVLYVGTLDADKRETFYRLASEHLASVAAAPAVLGNLNAFETDDGLAWHLQVEVSGAIKEARAVLVEALRGEGIEPEAVDADDWIPHVTLRYADRGEPYMGPVPSGQWEVGVVEVWGAPQHLVIPLKPGAPS